MVYPKNQVLPPSPNKKARALPPATSDHNTLPKPDLIASSTLDDLKNISPPTINDNAVSTMIHLPASTFNTIQEIMARYSTMIAMNTSSIKAIEVASANNTATMNRKLAVLARHVQTLEEHIDEIEDQAKSSDEAHAEVTGVVGVFVDSADILESRIDAVAFRVSKIESLIVRSRKRKLSKMAK